MEATIELLGDAPALARLREAEAAAAAGDVTTAEQMAELMRERRAHERGGD